MQKRTKDKEMSSTTRKKKPSAIRDFPLGCGRFAPRMTREELSAIRDFPEGCGRNAPIMTKRDLEESTEVNKTGQEGDADARTAGVGDDSVLSKAIVKVAELDDTAEKLTSLKVEVNNEKIDAMPLESEAKSNVVKESIDKLEDNQLLPEINVDDNTELSKLLASKMKIDRNKDSEEDAMPSKTTLSKSKIDTSKDARKESMQVKSMPKQPASKAKIDRKRDDKDIVPLKSRAKQPATKKKVDSKSDNDENIMASKQSASETRIEKKRDGKGNANPVKQEAKQTGQKNKSVKKGNAVGDISPLESKEAKEKFGSKNDGEDDVVGNSAKPDHADSESTPSELNIKEGDKPESGNDKNTIASAETSSIKRKKTPASKKAKEKFGSKNDGEDDVVGNSAEPDHADSVSTPSKLNIKEGDKPESGNDKNTIASAETSSIKRKKTPASKKAKEKFGSKNDGEDDVVGNSAEPDHADSVSTPSKLNIKEGDKPESGNDKNTTASAETSSIKRKKTPASKKAKEKFGSKNDGEDDDSAEPDHADSESTPSKLNIKEGDKPESGNDKNATASAETSSRKRKTPASRRRPSGKKAKVFRSGDGDDNLDAGSSRNEVRKTLMMFDALRRHYVLEDEASKQAGKRVGGGIKRPDMEAGTRMMEKGLWLNRDRKVVGDLPGVQPGDIFYFRFEMCAIGLHSQVQAGIHYIGANNSEWKDSVAVSIIASGGYEDDEDDGGETLVYTGSGGNSKMDGKQNDDQKLERGNLALERSMHHGVEIRVIRGKKDNGSPSGKIYTYDGLYKVEDYWLDKGKSGFGVFKYRLQRLSGQPALSSDILKAAVKWKLNPSLRQGLISSDISSKKENVPVYLVNTVDDDKGPEHFEYISEVKAPKFVRDCVPSNSCDCKGSCAPGGKCSCFPLNGGQMPYTHNGFLVKWRPMVYECSDLCSCSPTCRNRLTQKGLKFHLEVFKTENRGWGVRSWDPIPAGAFICEYVGEVHSSEDIDQQVEEDEYLLYAKRALEHSTGWGDVSDILLEKKQDDTIQALPPLTFAINAKNLGNVSRFINHSCSPNVLLQSVLYDHHNTQFPHIMLFAMEHIPPLTELTFDYGVIDSGEDKSYVKAKVCLCGSMNCRGEYP